MPSQWNPAHPLLSRRCPGGLVFFIIYNSVGVGVICAAAVVGWIVSFTFESAPPALAYVVGGVAGVILDLAYRFKFGEGDVFHHRKGGQVFFIPVWILGGLWILGSLGEMAAGSMEHAQSGSSGSNRGYTAYARSSQPDRQPATGSTWASGAAKPKVVLAEETRTFDGLKLAMIAGAPGHLVATINGEPFSEGESHKLRVGQDRVVVQCVQIRDQSVLVKIQGQPNPTLLRIGQSAPLLTQ